MKVKKREETDVAITATSLEEFKEIVNIIDKYLDTTRGRGQLATGEKIDGPHKNSGAHFEFYFHPATHKSMRGNQIYLPSKLNREPMLSIDTKNKEIWYRLDQKDKECHFISINICIPIKGNNDTIIMPSDIIFQ